MVAKVVDENVLAAANGRADHISPGCVGACVNELIDLQQTESLVLDNNYEILSRYARHCVHSGEPRVGDQFYIWAQQNAWRLRRVTLTMTGEGEYTSFPADDDLHTFDRDDRLYVATALAAAPNASVVNAVDSDYAQHADALSRNGLDVLELCPEELRAH